MKKVTKMEDLRVRRTRKLLRDALMSLLTDHDFGAITVNNICDKAMIHRTTFYNHYEDKYDLLNSGIAEMYQELSLAFEPPETVITEYTPDQPPQYFVNLFQHVLDHQTFYSAMFDAGISNPLREKIHAYIVSQSLHRLDSLPLQPEQSTSIPLTLIAQFNAGAIISALVWWIQSDYALTPDAMASHMMRLIAYGNFSLFKE